MNQIFQNLRQWFFKFTHLDRKLDEIKMSQALILLALHQQKHSLLLTDYEFKVFSQWGEDGIIQFLIKNIEICNCTFIEFGVEDFSESNCRFLLMNNLWEGYVIDGSVANIQRLRSSYFYWKYPLQSKASFITRENVCSLLDESGFNKDLGILSVDVDGMDYHLLAALSAWRPRILIVEYNAVFGANRSVTVPYDAGFVRAKAHFSNLYYGASLTAFTNLLAERGYGLVGVNTVGSNAFFVRRDLLNERVSEVAVDACFTHSTFREARDQRGRLYFRSARASRVLINAMPLIDTTSGAMLKVSELGDDILSATND
jgi:hypothetical protein